MRAALGVLLVLVMTGFLISIARFDALAESKTIFVPTDFPTIQAAINYAADGDTVFVRGGTYAENVIVNKTVSLVGENKSTTFIDAGGINAAVKVTVDNVSISGFTIGNGSLETVGAGVLLYQARYANISDNVIVSSYVGVGLMNSSFNSVQSNYVSDCNTSVYLNFSNRNFVQGNTLRRALTACVYLSGSLNDVIQGNIVSDSGAYGVYLGSSANATLKENRIEQNVGGGANIYFSPNCNITMNTFLANGYGILAQVSSNTNVIGNVIVNNTKDGVYFISSDNCSARDNDVTGNNGYGLNFQTAQLSIVVNNHVENNTLAGIHFYTCVQGEVGSNVAKYNQVGIFLQSCPSFTVNGNEEIGNAHQGMLLIDSPNNNVSANTILNNSFEGVGLQNSENSTLERNVVYGNGHYGIWLQQSPNIDISNSNASSNTWDGVYFLESNHGRVLNSVMDANGGAGFRLYLSNQAELAQNNITGNKEGLRVFLANDTNVHDNKIMQNLGYGINMYNCTGNRVYQNSFVNNSQDIAVLNASNIAWDDGYPDGGNYWSNYTGLDAYWGPNQDQLGSDSIIDTPYIIDAENEDRYPLATPTRIHDLTVQKLDTPSNEVYVGWVLNINVNVENTGGYVESFNVTLYCGSSMIETRLVSELTVGRNFTMDVTWNTTKWSQCNVYDVKAEVETVPREDYAYHNAYDFGAVKVKMVGDVNGDGKVNILDIAAIATAFGSKFGEPHYKLNYDMNLDYVVEIVDISMAAKNCGKNCK